MQKLVKHSDVINGERVEAFSGGKTEYLKASVYCRKDGHAYTFSLPEEKEKFYAFCTGH